MEISYKATFVRQFDKLDKSLQEEVLQKIDLFKNKKNHDLLKVHKLHGKFKDSQSFYVNYKFRIIFRWENEKEAVLLAIGDHDIYK
jgi:mRNA-degrading endonuclease YafQ of YafQ-DinJ toxin-antitoxin module